MSEKTTLGLIGGTGALGFGLAKRWLSAGYEVIIGSRSVERGGIQLRPSSKQFQELTFLAWIIFLLQRKPRQS